MISSLPNVIIIILYFNINFINFIYFLINYSFTMYELASVRFPLNEHVCMMMMMIANVATQH